MGVDSQAMVLVSQEELGWRENNKAECKKSSCGTYGGWSGGCILMPWGGSQMTTHS